MKKIVLIVLALLILLVVSIYSVYQYRSNIINAQRLNKEYEGYKNINILGTELISIINRTSNINIKNNIEKDSNGYYVDNGKNSIHIYIQFEYNKHKKEMKMEDIEKKGSEEFIKVYSTAHFKCTNIDYHEKTKNVKSLTFEEILDI